MNTCMLVLAIVTVRITNPFTQKPSRLRKRFVSMCVPVCVVYTLENITHECTYEAEEWTYLNTTKHTLQTISVCVPIKPLN